MARSASAAVARISGSRERDSEWAFPHPAKGCCEPGCPAWGRCHCGCDGRTATAAQNRGAVASSGSLVRGRPRVWVRGHAARLHVAGRGTRWSKAGVPGPRVMAMFEFLVRTYGTQPAVAHLLGISDSMVSLLRRGRVRMVDPEVAKRVVDLVLASRRPRDLFATFEVDGPRRVPTVAEREAMDRVGEVRRLGRSDSVGTQRARSASSERRSA
jgi:hypothetical protein